MSKLMTIFLKKMKKEGGENCLKALYIFYFCLFLWLQLLVSVLKIILPL